MAANRKGVGDTLDSKDFDAEFEKFMNEPLSDDSHPTPSPRYHRKQSKLEKHGTQESLDVILSDELSASESKSPSTAEKKQNVDKNQEENFSKKDGEEEYSAQITASGADKNDVQKESYTTETGEYESTLRVSKDDTIQDTHNFPERSFDGMDTLEELADKERFFRNLAADVSGTLDFAKLNEALDEIQSDQEKSDDVVTVLANKNLPVKEIITEPEVIHQKSKDLPVDVVEERSSENSGYESDSPPSESLKSIKEVAKARIKEAKERNKEKGGNHVQKQKISEDKERRSSISRLPRPLQESNRLSASKSQEIRKRSSSQRTASSHSSTKGSVDSASSIKSTQHRSHYKPHRNINTFSDIHLQFSEDHLSNKTSYDAPRRSRPNADERELPSKKLSDISRELQLQNELYELRADYKMLLDENEKLRKELERISKSQNENDLRLKYEFELEQLKQKNSTLERQLSKAKELRIRAESEDDVEKADSKEIMQLRKELSEQELLLNGYQLENERLFKEVKRRDSERKQMQSTLVEENQRLKISLAESEARHESLQRQLREVQKAKVGLEKSIICSSEKHRIDDGKTKKLEPLQIENDSLQEEVRSLKERTEKDLKVIKDLERQNNEMEKIIKKRYPDSVPGMLSGKPIAPDFSDKKTVPSSTGQKSVSDSRHQKAGSIAIERKDAQVGTDKVIYDGSKPVEFLEKKIKRMEKELDGKDEETARLLAASEMRYREMSEVYEKHIDGLQKQLSKAMTKHKSRGVAKTPSTHEGMKRTVTKDEFDESVSNAIEERGTPRSATKGKRREGKEKGTKIVVDDGSRRPRMDRASSPMLVPEDHDLEEVHRENIDLKLKLDQLRIEYEEMRVKNSAEIVKIEAESSKVRSNAESDIDKMKRIHNNEINSAKDGLQQYEQIVFNLQGENAQLEKKLSDYDFVAEKLKEKSLEAAVDKELLQAAKLKEDVLQNQVKLLQKQLKDAIDCQPPSQKRINSIEMQLSSMQQRQLDREGEIRNLVSIARPKLSPLRDPYDPDLAKIVEAKDAQIKQFREELDDILHTLHSLYSNGSLIRKDNKNMTHY